MGKAPADQFYWSDWLNDVELQAASTSSRGVWINALCRMWHSNIRGELSGSGEVLAKICNCKQVEFELFWEEAKTLGFCYTSQNTNGTLIVRNRRMYRNEKTKKANRLRQQRYYERHKDDAQPNEALTPPSSSSSSSSKKKPPISPTKKQQPTLTKKQRVGFDLFWTAYPKKQAKGSAEKAWKKINPDAQLIENILKKIEQAKNQDQWTKENGQYIPLPATWLNQERWNDEYEEEFSIPEGGFTI